MKNVLPIILILTVLIGYAFCEEEGSSEEEVLSIIEERRDILRYGIDAQVIDVLHSLSEEKNDSLTDEALEVFQESLNSKVRMAVLQYFTDIEHFEETDPVIAYLSTYEETDLAPDVITACIRYIASDPDVSTGSEAIVLFMDLSRFDDESVSRAAVEGLGSCPEDDCIDFLLELYDDDDTSENLKAVILTSLGKMKAAGALSLMLEILDDEDQSKSLRWRACQALGDIGSPEGLPALRSALSSDDTYLRSYAVSSLKSFEGEEIESLLIEALKDSFWRVRVSAAEALGSRNVSGAADILMFKVKKDPEANVRIAALEALGEIDNRETVEFLRNLLKDKRAELAVRIKSAKILIDHDLSGSLDIIEEVMASLWEESNSQLLDTLCRELSLQEHAGLSGLYERMLTHTAITIRLYGIRGIGRNHISTLKPRIEELSKEGNPSSIRKEALAVLEDL